MASLSQWTSCWRDPGPVRIRRRLDTFSRTLWFDPRGFGQSEGDPWDSLAGEIADADVTALLDTVGFQQPAMVGGGTFGPTAIHFAVTHPQRVSALVLFNTCAHFVRENDYPWGFLLRISMRLVPPPEKRGIRGLTSWR